MRGMASGWATPTEAGVLAVVYAVFVGAIQRNLSFKKVKDALQETVEATALILYVIAISSSPACRMSSSQRALQPIWQT